MRAAFAAWLRNIWMRAASLWTRLGAFGFDSGLYWGHAHGSLGRGFGEVFARFNGGGVACDVADETTMLAFADQSLMHEEGQLHLSEFVEGPGKGSFVGYLPCFPPATDLAQLGVIGKSV